MKWYFAVDEAGGVGQTGECAKLAVLTARLAGHLDPNLLYYGVATAFTEWMEKNGVRIINIDREFITFLHTAEALGTFKSQSLGHWLRIAIPMIETKEQFVIYTDCDVIFLRPFAWSAVRPRVFSAAPEFLFDNWNYFNSGVMLINVPAMRATLDSFLVFIRDRIESGKYFNYNDQWALNEAYHSYWDRLDPRLNWKPYWDYNPGAALLHFHGPKLGQVEAIATGGWMLNSQSAFELAALVEGHIDSYIMWIGKLANLLRNVDRSYAERLGNVVSALLVHKDKCNNKIIDLEFMKTKMFPN